jgi:hypothetical protein
MDFKYKFEIATKELIEKNIDALMAIDKHYFDNEGWKRDAFLSELPKKFDYSLLLMDNDTLVGYSIISGRDYGFHWHKLVLNKDYMNQGLGKKFFQKLMTMVDGEMISLKVHFTNVSTVIYHLKNGAQFKERQGIYYIMQYNG